MKTYQLTLDNEIYSLKEASELADSYSNFKIDGLQILRNAALKDLIVWKGKSFNGLVFSNKKLNVGYRMLVETLIINICSKYIMNDDPKLIEELYRIPNELWRYDKKVIYTIDDGFIFTDATDQSNTFKIADLFKGFIESYNHKSIELKNKIELYEFKVKDNIISFKLGGDLIIVEYKEPYWCCNGVIATEELMDSYFKDDIDFDLIFSIAMHCIIGFEELYGNPPQ